MTYINFEKIHSMRILLHGFKIMHMMAKGNTGKYFCYNNTGGKKNFILLTTTSSKEDLYGGWKIHKDDVTPKCSLCCRGISEWLFLHFPNSIL